ncbi:MAG TPA: YciI family protein [Streptosporangiaceae bacterium]|nr:YciI family protein [Streptosporangiaceae bacterium]
MPTFAVRTIHGPGWDDQRSMRQQDAWAEHASFMNALVDDGFVILGGPLGADGNHTGALLILEAASEDQLVARLNADPWARRDILAIGTVDTMTILLDHRGAG